MGLALARDDARYLGRQLLMVVWPSDNLITCRPLVLLRGLLEPLLCIAVEEVGVLQELVDRQILGFL